MKLHLLENRVKGGFVSFGSCWNKGEVRTENFTIKNDRGDTVAAQTEIAARWPDGSVKWARHTADSEMLGMSVTVLPKSEEENSEKFDLHQIIVERTKDGYRVDAGRICMIIPNAGGECLIGKVWIDQVLCLESICPVFELEHRREQGENRITSVSRHTSRVDNVEIELDGPILLVVKFQGVYCNETNQMPFSIRLQLGLDSDELHFENTCFYNGNEQQDFMKGMGLRFDTALEGKPWNRHVKISTDNGRIFHETAMYLYSYSPRTPEEFRKLQMQGKMFSCSQESEEGKLIDKVSEDLPVWNRYRITQIAHNAYQMQKQTKKECCFLDIESGDHAAGTMSVTGETGGIMIGIRDFWQRFPTGIEVDRLSKNECCFAWFYSPQAEAMDYRHYDTRSYQLSNYEGYPELGATANGIATTNECFVRLTKSVPSDDEFNAFTKRTQKPAVYVADPKTYHEKRAFGYWSLPCKDTQEERKLEHLLEQAVEFYQAEIEQRGWYGIYNYGDIMHSYDPIRHCWKYDFGGCAWQNTELVPTYWLWLYFMRTGREDVFTMAEAMSRHCSETDVYHFGPLAGIGSRHNVRHWGCSCKEPRISMAGHHRPLYYLTGDRRIGDYFEETLNGPKSLENISHYYKLAEDGEKLQIRTGPDWTAFVSDWMTAYERTLDESFRQKVLNGIAGIKKAPMKLGSGPSFCFDPDTGSMEYCGEFAENIHLTICLGSPQVWLEAAEALDCEDLYQLAADYGKIYLMTDNERKATFGALCANKQYGMNYVSAGLSGFGAMRTHDKILEKRAWETLMDASPCCHNPEGFVTENSIAVDDKACFSEIPWIATNYVSQWCLNVIMTLEFIRESLPSESEWDEHAAIPHYIPK